MPIDLSELAPPGACAVLTMEIQRGVVGDLSSFPQLAEAAEPGRRGPQHRPAAGRGPRRRGVPVVHCTAEFRADRAGTTVNCQLVAAWSCAIPITSWRARRPPRSSPSSGPEPADLVSSRLHGVSPFTGTALDTWLRNLGVRTVVATGVSVNLGVLGLAIEAVNLGYRVVVPRDAVAGIPEEYADAVLDNTFPLITTLTTVDDLIEAWSLGSSS